jgi:hypothetical protein
MKRDKRRIYRDYLKSTKLLEMIEEEDSTAAIDAKKKGLKYAGFGRWKDGSGKIVGKTENGKFVLIKNEPGTRFTVGAHGSLPKPKVKKGIFRRVKRDPIGLTRSGRDKLVKRQAMSKKSSEPMTGPGDAIGRELSKKGPQFDSSSKDKKERHLKLLQSWENWRDE